MAGSITIDDPHNGCREVDMAGETSVSGSSSGATLNAIFAQIWDTVPSPIPAKPLATHGADAIEGTVNGDGTWSIDSVMVPDFMEGNTYTLVVWSDFLNENSYGQTSDTFTGRSDCSA